MMAYCTYTKALVPFARIRFSFGVSMFWLTVGWAAVWSSMLEVGLYIGLLRGLDLGRVPLAKKWPPEVEALALEAWWMNGHELEARATC